MAKGQFEGTPTIQIRDNFSIKIVSITDYNPLNKIRIHEFILIVVGRIMVLKDVHALTHKICEYEPLICYMAKETLQMWLRNLG